MGKILFWLIVGIIIGAVGLRAYQDPEFRSQASEFVEGVLDWVSETPSPTPPASAMVALLTPTVTPVQVAPIIEVSPTPAATVEPSPTGTPEPSQPVATPTFTPSPTSIPASHSIEVVRMEALDNGQMDFTLEVRNEQASGNEIAQLEMSVDGGAPELVNIIANLPAGESASFAFARMLAPGPHTIRFTVGDSHTTVSVNVGAGDVVIFTPTPIPTNTPMPTATPLPTITAVPTSTPRPIRTPETAVSPDLRHLEEKTYMLELINTERAKAGLDPVVLGDNIAAQLHAEAALENCFASHWGVDGLKPYMRYSLAGGYQSNGENGHGSDYCIKSSERYAPLGSIESEIRDAIDGWMSSPGHRRNILGKWHKKVNIGFAWDEYNILAYQHFEGDYVEYDELPSISENGVLTIEGATKNGAGFSQNRELGVQIYHDQPPHALTRGQVTRTYCYDNGRQIASLRWPLTGLSYWPEDSFLTTHWPCPDPYDVPADSPGPRSHNEAHRFWQEAYALSQALPRVPITVPWITAEEWTVRGDGFSVRVDLNDLLTEHGDGVYTVMVWDDINGEDLVISQYSIFYGVTRPGAYSQ